MSGSKTPIQQARYLLIQVLYAWMIGGKTLLEAQTDIISLSTGRHKKATIAYLIETATAIETSHEQLQQVLAPHLDDISWEQLSVPVRAVLLLAAHEITANDTIPPIVSIHEAVMLAQTFAETGAYKLVNATLDAFARQLSATDDIRGY